MPASPLRDATLLAALDDPKKLEKRQKVAVRPGLSKRKLLGRSGQGDASRTLSKYY